ncbi:MAG TPA: hypothetical protein V6C97_03815 [Oculatellaceae cyanobacterium]
MSKNVIMILVCLLAVVGLGLWLQYNMVQSLRSTSALPLPAVPTSSGQAAGAKGDKAGDKTGSASTPAVGKKATLSAPVHKH